MSAPLSNGDNICCFKAASSWIESQKADDFERRCEEYMTRVFSALDLESTGTESASPDIGTIAQMKQRLPDHQKYGRILEFERGFELITCLLRVCDEMRIEVCL